MSFKELLVVVVWLAVTGILNAALRAKTPEQWVALADKSPRAHALIRILRALGFDPAKLVSAVVDFARARSKTAQAEDTEKKS